MATIKTEITMLIGRCRRVGWDVELQDNGYHKVTFDDGSSYLVHMSYSDRNAAKRVLRHMESMGLVEKEQALDEQHEAEKAERLAAERKAAAAAGRKMAAQARATTRAAGPYAGPERIPLSWFLDEHPAPWMRWAIIDPDLARGLLKRNTDNRPLKQATVDYYVKLIAAGKWNLTHQGMAMDIRGVLQDGQQRLQACIDADLEISAPFFVGMPVENFKAIDEGRNRTIADLFGKDGVRDPNLLGTAIRLIAAYREPYPRAFLRVRTPNEYLYDAFKGDPERLVAAVKWGRANYVKAKVVGGALAAAYYLLCEANGQNNSFVKAFFSGLVSGRKGDTRLMLDADDPRLLLRESMQTRREHGNRMRGVEQLGFILLAWNLVVDRSQAGRKIRWSDGQDAIPHIVVCRDKGRTASAPPDFLRGEFFEVAAVGDKAA
jgi:hypothetical protein